MKLVLGSYVMPSLGEGAESPSIREQGRKDIMEDKPQLQTHSVPPNINVFKAQQVCSVCYLEGVEAVRLEAIKEKAQGWKGGLEGEGACCQAARPRFKPQDSHGRRQELTLCNTK